MNSQNVPVKKIIEEVFVDTCHKLNHESGIDTKFRYFEFIK